MKRSKTALNLLVGPMALLTMVACQKEVVHERQTIVEKEAPRNEIGTIDGAGGSGVNGRPLESYRVDGQELSKSNKKILKAFTVIAKAFIPLAADMRHIQRERSWYVLPVSLNQIPSFKIGVYFSTDQIAIQNLREIWFDGTILDPMQEDDKARILIHEMLMGVRLMQYSSPLDRCLALAAQELFKSAIHNSYEVKRKNCFSNAINDPSAQAFNPLAHGARELTTTDYENIRYLTNHVLDKETLNGEELETWISINHFRQY